MTGEDIRFRGLIYDFIDMFSLAGPLVGSLGKEEDREEAQKRVAAFSSVIENLTPEQKSFMFHGIVCYLLMLKFDYVNHYFGEEMPTVSILADKMIDDLGDVVGEIFNLSLESAVMYCMKNPVTYKKMIDRHTESLMVMDAVNRQEGD